MRSVQPRLVGDGVTADEHAVCEAYRRVAPSYAGALVVLDVLRDARGRWWVRCLIDRRRYMLALFVGDAEAVALELVRRSTT